MFAFACASYTRAPPMVRSTWPRADSIRTTASDADDAHDHDKEVIPCRRHVRDDHAIACCTTQQGRLLVPAATGLFVPYELASAPRSPQHPGWPEATLLPTGPSPSSL
jgi:hypothetical protein